MSVHCKMSRIAATVAFALIAGIILAEGAGHHFFQRGAVSSLYQNARRWIAGIPPSSYDSDPVIVYWGDSLTAGSGATMGHDFPSLIAYLYHRHCVNLGVPGESSRQIRDRFLDRAKIRGPETVVIWAGRNNADEPAWIESDIRDMINSLNPDSRFLVLGVINSADPGELRGDDEYRLIMKLDVDLRAAYGTRFVPLHEILVASANDRFPEDRENVKADATPRSLRSDRLHLNDTGQAIVATAVENALVANGW